ncbi:MAG: S-layer homology domain-containing protein [Gorillibacterium sp.]|nr:S-layer homology domain-containing protein [Gorillibacterium sp.]
MLKKMILLTIILVLSLHFQPTASASNDAPAKWAQFSVNTAISRGLVPGRLQASYQSKLTRDEYTELLVQTIFAKLKLEKADDSYWTMDALLHAVDLKYAFTDTDKDYVKAAFMIGTVNGVTDTSFSPYQYVTRQEAATMLVNTVHYSNRIQYLTNTEMKYADIEQIASWALPAVKLAKSLKLMEGTGDRFNYQGYITREEAIVTALNLFNNVNYDNLTLRGNIPITAKYPSVHYTVGKDYVSVGYLTESAAVNDPIVSDMRYYWGFSSTTDEYKNQEVSTAQASIVYLFATLKTGIPEVINATVKKQPIAIDYGFMTMETLTKDYLITFRFKPIKGYMSRVAGYSYGYPAKIEIEPKVIEAGINP